MEPGPVRAELVEALGQTSRLRKHRTCLFRLASQRQHPAENRQHRRARIRLGAFAEQSDGAPSEPLGVEIPIGRRRAVGGIREHRGRHCRVSRCGEPRLLDQ
jgi:hypothetical protein